MRDTGITRIHVLFMLMAAVTVAITLKLFYLQVMAHGYYKEIAQREQYGYTTLPARRGEILIEDYQSGDIYKLATNTTLSMIFADPTLIDDSQLVADTLSPLLFDLEIEQELDEQRYEEELEIIMKIESEALRTEALSKLNYLDEEELYDQYRDNLEEIFDTKTREVILIAEELDVEAQDAIRNANMTGLELTENGNLYAYPGKINDKTSIAKTLSEIFDTEADNLESILLGKNRYVILKRKLEPEISRQIEEILDNDRELDEPQFLGIRMVDEYFRFYPEQELAAQVLGYVNSAGDGLYGIEGSYPLEGTDGIFASQVDAYGDQITVGESIIEAAQDGADVTLTLDRSIQLKVEQFLAQGVWSTRADSGQAIVIDPETGYILAMAHSPTFNPNEYGDVFQKVVLELTDEEKERIYNSGTEEEPIWWFYIQVDPDVRIPIFPDDEVDGKWWAYENQVGPEVYKNKTLQEVYEPGSVMKPLAMAAAVNAGEVRPNTTFVDEGPLGVDYNVITGEYDFTIKTFDNTYHGVETMTQVLQNSCNIGMAFVAKTLGPSLFYSYIKAFGFGERTEIGIKDEVTGKVEHYSGWTESELVTKAFGQGISMTPLQLVQAYTALANDGVMMKPQLVRQIEHPNGEVEVFEPEILSQVVTKETVSDVTAMMTATGESYDSLVLEDHYTAMKSGTAQTYKWGKALSGPGTTIGSFVAYGPIDDPKFLVLVKLDRPRSVEWGSASAGPVAKNILTFLYDYYNIPPDK